MPDPQSISFTSEIFDVIPGLILIGLVYYVYTKYIQNNFNSELDALMKLKKMLDDGLLSESEYNKIREKVLKKLNSKV